MALYIKDPSVALYQANVMLGPEERLPILFILYYLTELIL